MENNIVPVPTPEVLSTAHRFAIFTLGGLAAFAAQMLVEKSYIKGLTAFRASQTVTK